MKLLRKTAAILIIGALLMLTVSPLAAFASETVPYSSYTYDSYGNAVGIADIYEPSAVLYGSDFGLTTMVNPTDIFVSKSGLVYILDSGFGRVIILDSQYKKKEIIENFKLNGEDSPLSDPGGIFIDAEENILIADTGNNRVIKTGADGVIDAEILKPESEYFKDDVEFIPEKIIADRAGNMYVKCRNVYQGAVLFDSAMRFEGFFGSEKVVATARVLQDFFWKQFMTEEQKAEMSKYVPTEITNFDISPDDFIYSISPAQQIPWQNMKTEMDGIRRLNPKASDTMVNKMSKKAYEAMEQDARKLNFVDLAYDSEGYLNILDNRMGKIYHFDRNMQLISAFGALGGYKGTFTAPEAIAVSGSDILVLDKMKASVTVFSQTETGKNVHEALALYNEGRYEQAIVPWEKVLEDNPNFELAYTGIGSALYNKQQYREAMDYFKKGRDSTRYSEAFREYRIELMRVNLVYIFIAAGLLILLFFAGRHFKRKGRSK